jgi:2'-5' RNA ligase
VTAPPQLIRAFVALPLPPEVLARLTEIQRELRAVLPHLSTAWPKPENLHLTLRFLGNVSVAQLPQLQTQLVQTVTGFGPLDLSCERLGCFPDLRFPRVVWAWVHDANERLQQLQQRINAAVLEFAEKPAEARFVGHITLARPKQIKRADAEQLARFVTAAANRSFGTWRAAEVLLLRSELTPRGSRYHELARLTLG